MENLGPPIRESVRVLGRYVRARLLIALILILLYGIAFAAAHVPFWPLVAVIGGLASFVPGVGSLTAIGLAALAIVLDHASLEHLVIAFAGWVVIQALEVFVISPRLLSRPLGLGAVPVFAALLAGSFFFGPIGFLLAVPILAVAAVFWRYFRNKKENSAQPIHRA